MIKAVIFDLDGTLVDAFDGHVLAFNKALRLRGYRQYGAKEIGKYYGQTAEEIFRELLKKPYVDKDIEELARMKREFYRELNGAYVKILPGVAELLDALHRKKMPMGVASSANRRSIEEALRITGIAKYFPAIVASNDIRNSKPHPEIFLVAAEKLNIPPKDCLVFEDSAWGVMAAKAAGMKVIAVATGTTPKSDLKKLAPDMVIGTMKEILPPKLERILK